MAFQQYQADDRSPGALAARKFWSDGATARNTGTLTAGLGADGKKKSPFELVSVSKNPEMESLLATTLKDGLAVKNNNVPSGGDSFATLKGLADNDMAAGRNFLADYERRVGQDYGAARAAIDRADQDAIDLSNRGMETYGLGRAASAGANIGVGTELARVAGQAAATARNPALLALANLDADRTNRLNAARMGTLGRDFSIQSNLANFGRDVSLDPSRHLSARLSNLGAASNIERGLRFESVGGTFDLPGAVAPRFGSSMYVPPVRGYSNPAVSRVGPVSQTPPRDDWPADQRPPPWNGQNRGGSGQPRTRSQAEELYFDAYDTYPDQDPLWATSPDRQTNFRLGGGKAGNTYVPPSADERANNRDRSRAYFEERARAEAQRETERLAALAGNLPPSAQQPLFPPNDFSTNPNWDWGNAQSRDWNDARFYRDRDERRANLPIPNFTGGPTVLGENNGSNIFPVNY